MRKEEGAQRLTRVFYGLLLHQVFQPIAAFAASLFDSGAPVANNAFCPEKSGEGVRLAVTSWPHTTGRGCSRSAPFGSITT